MRDQVDHNIGGEPEPELGFGLQCCIGLAFWTVVGGYILGIIAFVYVLDLKKQLAALQDADVPEIPDLADGIDSLAEAVQ